MSIGPEPKPIRTGVTLHSLCITYGPFTMYKLFLRAYGGKSDRDLNFINNNCAQKCVNFYGITMELFKGEGHCVTKDSAYMGDIMALIGRCHEWIMDMIARATKN